MWGLRCKKIETEKDCLWPSFRRIETSVELQMLMRIKSFDFGTAYCKLEEHMFLLLVDVLRMEILVVCI